MLLLVRRCHTSQSSEFYQSLCTHISGFLDANASRHHQTALPLTLALLNSKGPKVAVVNLHRDLPQLVIEKA